MDSLHWPLSVLSRAIHFKNLSGASAHVGISQPQLSRLIQHIEQELNVTLLDRSVRRKSGWTPAAFRLSQLYVESTRKLNSQIHQLVEGQIPKEIHIGTLEGLSTIASELCHCLLKKTSLQTIELNVYDQNDLDEKFLNGDLDLCLTARPPSPQKYKHQIDLGYQTLDEIGSRGAELIVQSPFEFGREKKKKAKSTSEEKYFISNSLALRKHWLSQYRAKGILPSSISPHKPKGSNISEVQLIAQTILNEKLWGQIKDIAKLTLKATESDRLKS